MKNLVVHQLNCQRVHYVTKMKPELLQCIQCIVDSNCTYLYILMNTELYGVPMSSKDKFITTSITGYENSKAVALEFCITMQKLYCAYETGNIVKIDIEHEMQCDTVATLDADLQCMKFSPDHEVIAVVTKAGAVITMLLDFYPMSKVDLYSEDFGTKQFVTVGWGSKETQFHGSEGKAAAKTKPEQLNVNELDDGRPRITWRKDGDFFAVSFLHNITKIRQFKVFNREGLLCYTSESTNGLEECLAWNLSGDLIASTQRLTNKHVVAFFEKNGLKYTEFSLPFEPKEVKVKDLLWSPNSDILTIICKQQKTGKTILQLWIENNYHWYLKQTIVFPKNNAVIYATWSPTENYNKKELIILTLKEIISCSFNWCVNHSRGKTVDDKVVVGVIDGNEILVTGFRNGIVPPPMAHQTLKIQEPVNAIAFAPHINGNITSQINSNMFCTISHNSLTFFNLKMDSCTLEYEILKSYSFDRDMLYDNECDLMKIKECIYAMHHFLWLAEDIMLFSITTYNHNVLCVLSLGNSKEDHHLKIQKTYDVNGPIEYIIPSAVKKDTAYVLIDKFIFKYTRDMEELQLTNITLKEPCYRVEIIQIDSEDVIIALSHTDCFLIDGKEVAKNVTSFFVHSDFLLLTTLQHTLICVPLNKSGIKQLNRCDLTMKPWEHNINDISFADIYIRRIEKDSCIVAAVPQDSNIILQMPRGNLECIKPRALSLHILKFYLNNCNYLIAFNIMKKQRINLNLIYDHNPQLFMDNAEKFVESIANPNWLSLFLSELENEDVTSTMYANCYQDRPVRPIMTSENNKINKVEEICKLLRNIMQKRLNASILIQPILVSFVKNQQKQGLEKALNKIKEIKLLKNYRHSSSVSAEEALKYLLHFVNINDLYNTALGMYDIDMTMFVASKSSKDPKEYIPFLNSLKKLDKIYMKYSIDMYLKRYESALRHISEDPTKFEECLNLICNQKLYAKAIKLFARDSIEYKKVAEVYAEYLLSNQKYQEAGMMFYRSDNLSRALSAFSISGDNWQDAITISKEMELRPIALNELYKVLVKNLKTEKKYGDAAVILKDYLNDIEGAVAILCEGKLWKHAIRIAQDLQRLDLNETHIKPGVKEYAEHVISQLSNIKGDFLKYKLRLAVVRAEIKAKEMRASDKLINDNDETISNNGVADFFSGSIVNSTSTRSQTSTASKRSYRSNKNRRKQERKLLNVKEGSMFEDLGLIHALYQIISNAYKDRDDWYQLAQVLIRFKFDDYAEKLQVKANEFFRLVESGKSEIWNKSAPSSLAEIEKTTTYTQAQLQEITAPIKLVERYITHPPETNATPCVLSIF